MSFSLVKSSKENQVKYPSTSLRVTVSLSGVEDLLLTKRHCR
jgi:hypothetical protein